MATLLSQLSVLAPTLYGEDKNMDQMWGDKGASGKKADDPTVGSRFKDGNYAMFIHWGLFSTIAGKWKDKTYYGIGEWIMNPRMAGIPVEEYKNLAHTFNPDQFDAKAVVQLAKAAGMKYIVITSKHHEGFAMFKSAHPFNVVDATPFQRDIIKELSEACREADLGFGLYYSHFQDWTSPGASGGPKDHADGSKATFEQYFRDKCYPQVKEICTKYGPLEVIWFDTPGSMPKENVVELHDLVRKTQPKALLGSRIGHGMGDYESLGDMEVPLERVDGLWEACDTTNDSWAYAWYDSNWKDSREILVRVVSTVARGGTYLLNIGLDGKGNIPTLCQKFLKKSGDWIQAHPNVVYNAGPSPWRHAMPWGDITTQEDGTLNLVVFECPKDRYIYLPTLANKGLSASTIIAGKNVEIPMLKLGNSLRLQLPVEMMDALACVIQVKLDGKAKIEENYGIHPNMPNTVHAVFAEVEGANKSLVRWMEKFGEWKAATQVSKWTSTGVARWKCDFVEAGTYHVTLRYRGKDRLVWNIKSGEGEMVQNQQAATSQYANYPMGIMEIKKPGIQTLEVRLVEGDTASSSLEAIVLNKIE